MEQLLWKLYAITDACARHVQPVNFEVGLTDGALDIIIIQEFGEYRIHAIERHI